MARKSYYLHVMMSLEVIFNICRLTRGAFHSTKITSSNFRNFAGRMEHVRLLPGIRGHVLCNTGHVGETLLCLKMARTFWKFWRPQSSTTVTISCTILYRNDDVILLAAIACFMQRELTSVNGYFEVTIPAYLSGEFKNHFRMTREKCQLLTREIMHTGRISTGNLSGRPAILADKQILLFLWSVANKERSSTGRLHTIVYRPPLLLFQVSTTVHARLED